MVEGLKQIYYNNFLYRLSQKDFSSDSWWDQITLEGAKVRD